MESLTNHIVRLYLFILKYKLVKLFCGIIDVHQKIFPLAHKFFLNLTKYGFRMRYFPLIKMRYIYILRGHKDRLINKKKLKVALRSTQAEAVGLQFEC